MTKEINKEELLVQQEYIEKVKAINAKREQMPLAHVHSFGCQQNVSDGEKIKGMLAQMGYGFTPETAFADLILFNTCAVRENAEDRVFGNIGALKKLKEKNRNLIIAVGGCMVQQEHIAQRMRKSFPQVDIIFGTHVMHTLPQMIYEKLSENRRTLSIPESDGVIAEGLPVIRESKVKASVPIMYGCNNFCTYCVVPYTRGVEYSRPVASVLREARRLVETGSVEINLLGQNVNSYHGEDENGRERNLAYLLRRIAEIDGLQRIRYTTSYPADVDDDLIACHRDLKKLMPYLHLPIQSGSDRILRAMNRRHNSSDYLRIVEKLQQANPALRMSSDFIVGFPGETDEDFRATLDVVDRVKYIQAFSFKYSRRPGTPAAVMNGQVEEKVKKERLEILQNLLFSYQLKFNKECLGKIMPVLFETRGRHAGQLIGRTPYMQNLHAKLDKEKLNKIINVRVTEATTNSLSGEPV